MAVSESRKKATKKYNDKKYDQFTLRLPKGEKEFLQNLISEKNSNIGSLNELICYTLEEWLEKYHGLRFE
jgi:hypothetical protein